MISKLIIFFSISVFQRLRFPSSHTTQLAPSNKPTLTPTTTSPLPPQTKESPRPFRGFDISSLIHKDEDEVKREAQIKKEDDHVSSPASSPKVSYGPPVEKSTNPYSNIFNSNLYQQYLGQILSQQQQQAAFPHPAAFGGFPPAFNPMLLQAHLLAQAHNGHNPLLSSYTNGLATSIMAERMKANRYSPYSPVSSSTLNTSASSSLGSPTGVNGSAFRSLTPRGSGSPPVSPPHSTTPPVLSSPSRSSPHSPNHNSSFHAAGSPNSSATLKPESPLPRSPVGSSTGGSPLPPHTTGAFGLPPKSDIKSIEKMISGLNGGGTNEEGRFGLAHDARKFV